MFYSLIISIISSIIGIDILEIIKNAKKRNHTYDLKIGENIDLVSKNLYASKDIIENTFLEMKKQKELFEQLKKEADVYQQIKSMNKEQVDALNHLLEKTLVKQEKRSLPKTIIINSVFCILGAFIGYFLGKFF
jgi:hypothetical protein